MSRHHGDVARNSLQGQEAVQSAGHSTWQMVSEGTISMCDRPQEGSSAEYQSAGCRVPVTTPWVGGAHQHQGRSTEEMVLGDLGCWQITRQGLKDRNRQFKKKKNQGLGLELSDKAEFQKGKLSSPTVKSAPEPGAPENLACRPLPTVRQALGTGNRQLGQQKEKGGSWF